MVKLQMEPPKKEYTKARPHCTPKILLPLEPHVSELPFWGPWHGSSGGKPGSILPVSPSVLPCYLDHTARYLTFSDTGASHLLGDSWLGLPETGPSGTDLS